MSQRYPSLKALLTASPGALKAGPIAVIIAEDDVEIDSTLRHHLALGFGQVILFAPERVSLPPVLEDQIIRVDAQTVTATAASDLINPLIKAAEGQWIYYCYNTEYLFFPFCENRSIAEMLAFHTEERREAMRAVVLDLYPGDLTNHPEGVALEDAWFDGAGYFALPRLDPTGQPMHRQDEIHGGMRWRFEQEIPVNRRKLDRVPIFRAKPELQLLTDHRLSEGEMNTISSEWHRSLTAVIASFRSAKALISNTSMSTGLDQFRYAQSVPFEWQSSQLMELGFMEPGQWF